MLYLELLVFIFPVIFIMYVFSLRWKKSIAIVLILIVLEGVLRKWVLPQASSYIYFVKDLILLGAYFGYFFSVKKRAKIKNSYIKLFIYSLLLWGTLQVFNPSLGSPIIGIFGIKVYFLYIPIIFILPDLFRTQENFYKFVRHYLLLVIPVCLLGVAQFFSPVSSPINFYAGGNDIVSTFGTGANDAARITGTFPYITGFGTYLAVCFTLILPLLTKPQTILWRWITIAEGLLIVATSFMTGSRSVVFYEGIFIICYILILWVKRPNQTFRSFQKLVIPILVITILTPAWFGKGVDIFSQRAITNQTEGSTRLTAPLIQSWEIMQFKGLDSYGIGTAYQATPLLRSTLNLPMGERIPGTDSEPPRIMIELGPLGFILWYGLRLALIISLWQVFNRLEKPFLRQLALAVFLFNLIQVTTPVVFNPTMGIYYWFLAGFIFLLPELERREKEYLYYQQYEQQLEAERHV